MCQNFNVDFKAKKNAENRHFSLNYLKRELSNGDIVTRDWVIYSPSKNAVYCFVCRLFGTLNLSDSYKMTGFNDWKNIHRSFKIHECSAEHMHNDLTYKTRRKEMRSSTLDECFTKQSEQEMEYWRKILRRIVAAIKFLASRGLAFRGLDQKCGSIHNGNYLGLLDFLAEFDPLTRSHIDNYGNKGKGMLYLNSLISEFPFWHSKFAYSSGRASYLSDTICDEFIDLIGQNILKVILTEVRDARYFSISVDSTPDVSHADQLVFCIRYVKNDGPIERFLQFIPINQHKSEYLTDIILDFMKSQNIDILNCRGQSYDNTNNMAGKYSGLQQRILEINRLAIFLPCASHSMNLVGSNAVASNKIAASFFSFLEKLYTFFVYSTARWDLLTKTFGPKKVVLKRATGTRWSAKHDSVSALSSSVVEVRDILLKLINDDESQTTPEHKAVAKGLLAELCKFQNLLMLKIWNAVLSKFHIVSKSLQKSDLNLSVTVQLYRSLLDYFENLKHQFDSLYYDAKILFEQSNAEEYILHSRSAITLANIEEQKPILHRTIFTPIIDALIANLNERLNCYIAVDEKFSFLVKLDTLTLDEISAACNNIALFYKNDIDKSELLTECEIAKHYFFSDPSLTVSHASMYATIIKDDLQNTFPNIEIVLRIFLSLFVTNAPDERSFSKLKLIKNALRNRMSEAKLNALASMSIESDVLNSLDFEEIINEFVLMKNRKKNITTTTSNEPAK